MSTFSLSSVFAQLTSFANLENFWSLFNTAFGSSYVFATAATLRSQWQSGNFSQFPQIEVVSSDVLGGAKGAYGISTNRIYLSDRFVSSASQQSLEAVILEEFGHFVDAQVNTKDTPGDEGELFSALVRGVNLSTAELGRIKTENDHAMVIINGQATAIEQSAGTIIQLTNNDTDDGSPQISGNNVVWTGYDGNDREIYFYNGTTTTQLTNNDTNDSEPQISGNNVVWTGFDGNDLEIYFYNGTTTTQLTNNNRDHNNDNINDNDPQISGNNVVWSDSSDGNYYSEIYFYNGTTTTQLTNNNINATDPQISGNNVVWIGFDDNDSEIYFYNGTTTTQLTNNDTNDSDPQISGNNVVWTGFDGNDNEIFFYNGTTITQLTNNNIDDNYPQISGNNIVWQGDGGDNNYTEIYFYNGTTTTQLTNNGGNDSPQISGNNIVWNRFASYELYGEIYLFNDIYFYNGTTTTQLTITNNISGRNLQISGNNIVRQAWDGNDYEIYTYQISSALPTLSIAPTNASQAEGNSGTKAFTFTVTRSVNTTGINAVNWTVTGSGTNPANVTDFAGGVLPTGTVSFAVGETSKVITVNVQGDLTNEPNDGFAVTLSSPTNGATITTAIATGTITNDDEDALPVITLAVNPASVSEDAATNLVYTFTRTGPTTNALTLTYDITGTADATDYTGATPGTGKTINFAANSATATLTINPTADTTIEADETVALTLATGAGYTIGTTTDVLGTIINTNFNEITGNPLINNGRNPIVGTAGPDYLTGGAGAKTLTGGGGNDAFVFTNMRDVGQRIADFTFGQDKLVFTQLFSSLGYTGSNPIADGYIKFVKGTGANSAHTFLQIDRDGLTGSAIARNFLQVDNITPTLLNNSNNFQF
jgi:beta propeller repeat protein